MESVKCEVLSVIINWNLLKPKQVYYIITDYSSLLVHKNVAKKDEVEKNSKFNWMTVKWHMS